MLMQSLCKFDIVTFTVLYALQRHAAARQEAERQVIIFVGWLTTKVIECLGVAYLRTSNFTLAYLSMGMIFQSSSML